MFNSFNLYKNEWLNLVFKNRNQHYGAFQLRLQANRITLKSFGFSAIAFVAIFVLPKLFAMGNSDTIKTDKEIEISVVPSIDLILAPKVTPAQKSNGGAKTTVDVAQPKSVSMSSNIVVTKKDQVIDPVRATDLLDAQIISSEAVGKGGIGVTAGLGNGGDGAGNGKGMGGNGDEIYSGAAEVNPTFPGGMDAWAKFVERNLRYPMQATESNVQGKVFISFVVEKDGHISDVKIIKGLGYGCEEEAMRVIRKSPRWNPGMQNGRPVRVRYQMPINYSLVE